jgi:hypothetical protein
MQCVLLVFLLQNISGEKAKSIECDNYCAFSSLCLWQMMIVYSKEKTVPSKGFAKWENAAMIVLAYSPWFLPACPGTN